MTKIVYILSNLGTPAAPTEAAVSEFLKEFLYDPSVITLPTLLRYPLVHWLIAPLRGRKSAEKYKMIWREDGSPLLVWSLALQREVQKHLNAPVLLGMRYGNPSLASAFAEARELKAERIVLSPLYPQFAEATTGSTISHFRQLAVAAGFQGRVSFFPAFPRASFFVNPLAETIRPLLRPESHLLLSFHGLPVKQLNSRHCGRESCCDLSHRENISCYRSHCLATAQEITRQLGISGERWTLSFQSRFGNSKWMGPHTDELLRQLAAQGKKDLVVAAPSFVADCLETAEELGLQAREIFQNSGGERFELASCLNGDPQFARGLAEALQRSSSSERVVKSQT